jgi:multidrug efflux pump subunit AcrA (membrane-fusion protein)
MAIVSLRRQRVTLYDSEGWIMRAPVSSGRTGYETPAGIYSILQRKVEHYSNLYDDAAMPYMQRLTWSGIALHAGPLPGYPASHGCVRMPSSFAPRLFDATRLGMRVIVMRDDIAPAPFAHPKLFKPWSEELASRVAVAPRVVAVDAEPQPVTPHRDLRKLAAAKAAEAELAAKRLEEARRAAASKQREAALANRTLRVAQSTKLRAEAKLRQAERQLENARESERQAAAEEAKAGAAENLAQAEAEFEKVRAQVEPVLDEVKSLREAAIEAQKAKTTADDEAREAKRKLAPISVFVSRANKRLYVRQGFQPLFDTEVAIADADKPLGTYVFTALAYENGEKDLRWNAVSMYNGADKQHASARGQVRDDGSTAMQPDVTGAAAALERVTISDDALERISAVISPGSSLIVSDEPLSRETGPATEFIVVMSTEPQGGIKMRRPQAERRERYDRFMRRSPSSSGFSWFW